MASHRRRSPFAPWALVVVTALAGACSGGGTPTVRPTSAPAPTPSPSAMPPASPSATASASFTLQVKPAELVGRTMGGTRVVFLITVEDVPAGASVAITASAPNAQVTVEPASLSTGVVGEVTVIPKPCDCEAKTVVQIDGTLGEARQHAERTLEVVAERDQLGPEARAHLAPFLPWLATTHPELGITPRTAWDGSAGSWVLIVEHYLFFSKDWELDLEWHVMIAPDDWSRIYLRKRWVETAPSLAFEISSVSAGSAPHAITPPDAVWR